MADTAMGTEMSDAVESVEGTAGAVGKTAAGAVGGLIGVLTGGFAIAAGAGFVVGVAVGVAARAVTGPPPLGERTEATGVGIGVQRANLVPGLPRSSTTRSDPSAPARTGPASRSRLIRSRSRLVCALE